MKKLFTIALLMFALPAAHTSFAAQSECSAITDPAERLKCFDAQFPTDQKADDVGSEDIIGPIMEEEVAPVAPRVTTTTPAEPAAAAPTPAPKSEKPAKRGFLGGIGGIFGGDKEEFTATIVDMLDKNNQQMIFQLDNDEIWVQTTGRSLAIKIGDKVTIKSGNMGGYVMRTDSGISTRVSRFRAD